MNAEEMLNSADYFHCEKLKCRLPLVSCKKRQTRGINSIGSHYAVPYHCQDCRQGQDIMAGNNFSSSTPEAKKRSFESPSPPIRADIDVPGGTIARETLEQLLSKQEAKMEETGKEQTKPEKKRKQYPKLAPCVNCGRVLPLQGKGLCGGCRAVSKTTPPSHLEAALAEAKLRFSNPNFDSKRRCFMLPKTKIPVEHPIPAVSQSVIPAPTPVIPSFDRLRMSGAGIQEETPTARIGISFPETERNLKVWGYLCAEADRNRRSPEMQMLWTLETLMKSEA